MASGAVTAGQGRRPRHELNPFACVEAKVRVGDGSRAAVEATANRASTLSKHAVTEHKLFRYLTPPDPPLPPYTQSEGGRLSVDSSSGVRQYLRTYCSQARGDLVCGLGTRPYSPWQNGPGSSSSWFRYQQIEGWRPRGTPRDPGGGTYLSQAWCEFFQCSVHPRWSDTGGVPWGSGVGSRRAAVPE
jgi:hypothetical protein